VTSFNGRVGAVSPANGDYTAPMITFTPTATLPVVTTVDAALNALSHSINTLTIWVAQGDENAVDPPGRAGISPYDARHPFLTLGAALAAVTVSNTTIRIRTGVYDEDVTAPAFDVAIIGDGPDVIITRIQFTSGSYNYLQSVRMINDPLTSSAPNLSPIVQNNAGLLIRDVLNEEYYIDDIAGDPQALMLTAGGALRLYNSNFYAAQVVTGAGGSTGRAICGLKVEGAGTCSVVGFGCKFTGLSASDDDSAAGIWWATTNVNSNLSLTSCDYLAATQDTAALGTAANIFVGPAATAPAGRIDIAGGIWEANANVLSTSPVVLAYVASNATVQVNISHPTVRALTGNAAKIGAGACDIAGNTLRLLDVSWPTFTTIPPRQGALLGTYVHEGVLGNGDRFPAPFWIDTLTVWVAQGDENATDTRTGLSPYDQNHPFLTMTAAMAAVLALATPNITVRVRTGYYDEAVAVPPGCAIIGDGPEVFLVRLTFSAGENFVRGVRTYNDAAFVSAPNLAPFSVAGGTVLAFSDVISVDYYADDLAAESAALLIEDSFIRVDAGCQFFAYQLVGGAGVNGPVWCGAWVKGVAAATLVANVCTFVGSTNVHAEFAAGVYHSNTHASTTISCVACVLNPALAHNAATGTAAGVVTASALGKILVSGGQIFVDALGPSTPSAQVAAFCLSGTINVDLASVAVYLRGPASNQGGGVSQGSGVTLRMIDMVWPGETVEPPRLGLTTGGYVHEGVLGNGNRFPAGFGTLAAPSSISFTSGPPTTEGMVVLRNTSLDVGVWSDITALLNAGTATDLFSTTASGAALYFGSDTPVWAVALNITQAAALGVGAQFNAEYWDGASWSNVSAMETDRTAPNATTPPKRRGRSWLTTTGGLYFRWGAPAAALLSLDGNNKYWLRISTAGGLISTQPQANEAKLVGNGEQRDSFGYIQYFGSASPNCDIMERKFKDLDVTSASNPAAVTITIGDLPYSLTIDDASFANAATNRTAEITHLPGEVDTSRLAKLQIFWYRAAGTAGLDVLWEWSFQTKNNGENFTTVGATTIQSAETVPAVVNVVEVLEFDFDFLNQRVAADTFLSWYLTRLGTDVLDTFDASANVVLIAANGYKWRP